MKGINFINYKTRLRPINLLIAWIILPCIIWLQGCAIITSNMMAKSKSGAVGEKRGSLLQKKIFVLEEYPPTSLSVSLKKVDSKSIQVILKAKVKQRIKVEKVYQRIVEYHIYEGDIGKYPIILDIFATAFIIPGIGGAFDYAGTKLKSKTEKVEGELSEKVEEFRDISEYVPETLIRIDGGLPANTTSLPIKKERLSWILSLCSIDSPKITIGQ